MKFKRLRIFVWLVGFSLVFGLGGLGVSVVGQTQAQEPVDYYLPYPGILPDHPMYWLKMTRDRVQLWLISKSENRANRLLLYADKRLAGGFSLIENNKISLGVTTLTKAEKYLEQAIALGQSLEGAEDLKEKLNKANLKHKEVLLMVKEKVGDEYKTVVEQMLLMNSVVQTGEESEGYKLLINDGESLIEFEDLEAKTALELLEKGIEANKLKMEIKEYDFGSMVESIGDKPNTKDKAWIYKVNGEWGTVAVDAYELKSGDLVEWQYVKPIF